MITEVKLVPGLIGINVKHVISAGKVVIILTRMYISAGKVFIIFTRNA